MSKVYKHYKGKYYRILSIADHTETREKMVVYEQLYTNEYPYGYIYGIDLITCFMRKLYIIIKLYHVLNG